MTHLRRKSHPRIWANAGLSTVEYIIILCLIAVVCFAAWQQFGSTVKAKVLGADSVIGELDEDSSTD